MPGRIREAAPSGQGAVAARAFARKLWIANSPAWRFDEAMFARAAQSFDNPDFVRVLASAHADTTPLAVTAPVITLLGGASGVAALTGASGQRLIEGAGHDLPQEAPPAFAAAVAELVHNATWHT